MAGSFGDVPPGPGLDSHGRVDGDLVDAARLLRRFGVYALVLTVIVAVGGYTILGFVVAAAGGALLWAGVRG
ncbi:hypothetical protein IU483_18715 [Streptomyces gardneri]|nr:hypothetical protein [Streptomyces gardneri]